MADLPTQLSLEIATPLGKALSVETDSVQVPSVAGEFGVLPGHLPILAALKPGILQYRHDGRMQRAAVGGGFAEADGSHVRLITEFFVKSGEVDAAQARKDLETAEARLKQHPGLEDIQNTEAQRDYDWARARLTLAGSDAN